MEYAKILMDRITKCLDENACSKKKYEELQKRSEKLNGNDFYESLTREEYDLWWRNGKTHTKSEIHSTGIAHIINTNHIEEITTHGNGSCPAFVKGEGVHCENWEINR